VTGFLLHNIEWIALSGGVVFFISFVRVMRGTGRKKTILRACYAGDEEEVRSLLREVPYLAQFEDPNGFTPLHLASLWDHESIVETLIRFKADVNARNETGMTPLHSAAMAGHARIAHILLAYGADPNARDSLGNTPLYMAVWDGRRDVVELLLQHGADPTLATTSGDSPLARAERGGHHAVAALLGGTGQDAHAAPHPKREPAPVS
jgi:ankyrin repeat protein